MKWLAIPNYELIYEVSDTGLVRSIDREILVKGATKPYIKKGQLLSILPNKNVHYMQVSLWKNNIGLNYYVHRLVAQAFIPNPNNLPEVNHIDGNRQNNNVSNLEWIDRTGNYQHAIDTGLRVYKSRLTREEFIECLNSVLAGESYYQLSQRVPYKVPFLSTKLRQIAAEEGLEDDLNKALELQRQARAEKTSETLRLTRGKPVAMYSLSDELLMEFPTIAEAAHYLNTANSGAISNACTGRSKTACGYKWRFINESE